MNILVTGANGQLGSELRALSDQSSHSFIFTDVNELDILNADAIQEFVKNNPIDVIINCAAYTAVDKAEEDVETARALNALAVSNLVSVCEDKNIKLIHISTDYVFDGHNFKPLEEHCPVAPIGVYGKTKREGEEYLLNSKITGAVIRTSWLYSSYGNNFVKSMMRLGREKNELGVIFDQIGTPTYAADLAQTILTICQHPSFGCGSKLIHYSNEGVASWYDFASAIMEIAGIDCCVKPIETKDYPTPAARPYYSVMNKALIKEEFGIEIPYWRDSLRKCIERMKEF
ncbi:dTDP-4-dehydrorhamnose reductase [Saccharicrinis carchari]|uniref:dTDP-4-dehydrorhamnose reductase n=1 Tax=Saccharicrinis carchari TaxID=1168039 RepID=A0A521EV76_SACCC|nr:dTDP-4-dehydrorhamnose reductase [Saccharicrinis carchari]SMO87827.1 dTDP-4-dehydrorhamnose reductase [Saccharicrinis carchari]